MTDNGTPGLREKLDKLGIEHLDSDLPNNKQTRWNKGAGGWGACYVEITHSSILPADSIIDYRTLRIYNCTPEQAIAATLGSGTCENLSSMNVDGVAGYHFICSECGLSVCASMGIGEIEPSGPRSFRWKVDGRYEFERCPRCGKEVKR